ncbi:hypothetical protein FIV00_26445 [Labrenzia sp. THAF82]|nr:hypothetical protein FIV00_26255 [Labrenzia sp. THAF82]QFT34064.1 hypothetical protein FIV00_26445 [Labrenzia sp. THAF82]
MRGPGLSRNFAIGVAAIALVGNDGPMFDVEAGFHEFRKLLAVRGFATGQLKAKRQAVPIRFQMDFGAEPAARTPERLTFLPPLAPAAETWARMTVLSNMAIRCAPSSSPARMEK